MKDILRSSLKTALIFGFIGIVASLAVPPLVGLIAPLLGGVAGNFGTISLAHTASVALTFFTFGLLEPIVKSTASFAFGTNSSANPVDAAAKDHEKKQAVVIRLSPEHSLQPTSKFVERLNAERAAAEHTNANEVTAAR